MWTPTPKLPPSHLEFHHFPSPNPRKNLNPWPGGDSAGAAKSECQVSFPFPRSKHACLSLLSSPVPLRTELKLPWCKVPGSNLCNSFQWQPPLAFWKCHFLKCSQHAVYSASLPWEANTIFRSWQLPLTVPVKREWLLGLIYNNGWLKVRYWSWPASDPEDWSSVREQQFSILFFWMHSPSSLFTIT